MAIHTTRRALLALTGAAALAACTDRTTQQHHSDDAAPMSREEREEFVSPAGPEVAAAEHRRETNGTVRKVRLTAVAGRVELGGGRGVRTWTYGGELPGKAIRLTAGDTLSARFANHLPHDTSVHWHGLALRNDMDGVPDLTQPPIRKGGEFAYRFTVDHPGTYWFHPHTGVQLDRGLYAPLIVDDPREPLSYDHEWIVVLDDWLDGVGGSTPDKVLKDLGGGKATKPSRRLKGSKSRLLSGRGGHVDHPLYLINGRTAGHPSVFKAKPGDRIRIRFINAGADTAFRVALGGHRMTVTHTDGFPVRHKKADRLLIGMGERYDVLVKAHDGVFPLTALAEGKNATALAVLRTAKGAVPAAGTRPAQLRGKLVSPRKLRAADSVRLPDARPDRTIRLTLTGGSAEADWAFDRRPHDHTPSAGHRVREGERVRLRFVNHTGMWHPVHVHGHTFQMPGGGPRKDTAVLLPGRTLSVDLDADNPGLWMLHCHNLYHQAAGMMTVLGYASD